MDTRGATYFKFKELKFLQIILSVLILSTTAGGHSTELKDITSPSHDNETNFKCPLWFYYNSSTQSCQCLPYYMFSCNGRKAYVITGYAITVQQNQSLLYGCRSKSFRFYNENNSTNPGYTLLPDNISDLNDFMCGPLNRKGYLCSDCIDGFGPSMTTIEHPNDCYRCIDSWRGLILYIIIVLVPVTLFYFIILVFQIRMTSAPTTCFILYSQLIVILFSNVWGRSFKELSVIMFTEAGDLRAVTRLILVLYGVFNLDFIRYVLPPFCISNYLRLNHRAILGYITAFYPMLLIVITWICIELHDRNFRVIVYLWRPFHRCFVRLRREWDTKNDLIDVFATFFLLSYVKIMNQTILMISTTLIDRFSLDKNYLSNTYVSDFDNTINVTGVKYITGSVFELLIFFIFNFLPVLLLVLYPCQRFRRILSKLQIDRISLMIFMERFHSCYRDGLDGRRDKRYFSGLYFFLLMPLAIIPPLLYHFFHFDLWFTKGTIFLITVLIVSIFRPYKKMYMNVSDLLLLSHLAMLCFILSQRKFKYFVPFIQTLTLFPFVVLVFVICFKFVCKTRSSLFIKLLCQSLRISSLKADSYIPICNIKEPKIIQSVHSYGSIE